MKLFDRISSLTGKDTTQQPAQQPEQPAADALARMEQNLAALPDRIAQALADVHAATVRKDAADLTVRRLTEQAAAGTLDDPARLVEALRLQREIAGDDSGTQQANQRLQTLQDEKTRLEAEIHTSRSAAARETYFAAVRAYAEACAPLVALAARVRQASSGVIMLTEHNTTATGLIGRQLLIGGAVVQVPAEIEQ